MTFSGLDRAAIPVLRTERLVLRPHEVSDFEASFSLWSDAQVVRFIGGRASTEEEVWARVLRYAGHWSLFGFGYWLVETPDGGFLGEIGIATGRVGVTPSIAGEPEMGWAFRPAAQGRGYAREAMRAVIGWADAALCAQRLVSLIEPRNARSVRAAEDVGFTLRGEARYRDAPSLVLERARCIEEGMTGAGG